MGFKDGLKDFGKDMIKRMTSNGWVSSSDFPVGTYLNWGKEEEERCLRFTLPNKEEYVVTHDMVRYATVLAMGVIHIEEKGNTIRYIHGTKYKVEFVDGKTAVITADLASSKQVENVLF